MWTKPKKSIRCCPAMEDSKLSFRIKRRLASTLDYYCYFKVCLEQLMVRTLEFLLLFHFVLDVSDKNSQLYQVLNHPNIFFINKQALQLQWQHRLLLVFNLYLKVCQGSSNQKRQQASHPNRTKPCTLHSYFSYSRHMYW